MAYLAAAVNKGRPPAVGRGLLFRGDASAGQGPRGSALFLRRKGADLGDPLRSGMVESEGEIENKRWHSEAIQKPN